MNVRVTYKDGSFIIYDAESGEEVGRAANDLNLRLQYQARGWVLLNPPLRRRRRKEEKVTAEDDAPAGGERDEG